MARATKGEDFQISTAVRDRALHQKRSLLVVDALTDSDFAVRHSIVRQGVRSMIAAPLQTGNAVIGLLYVDLTNPTRSSTRDDLNLLTVMANIAANSKPPGGCSPASWSTGGQDSDEATAARRSRVPRARAGGLQPIKASCCLGRPVRISASYI